jgi:hypothetical protein
MTLGMSIVEQDELIKTLSNDQLQNYANSPDGTLPLYLVVAQLKRNEDTRDRFSALQAEQQTAQQPRTVVERLAPPRHGEIPVPSSQVAANPSPQIPLQQVGGPAPMPTINAAKGLDYDTLMKAYATVAAAEKEEKVDMRRPDHFGSEKRGSFEGGGSTPTSEYPRTTLAALRKALAGEEGSRVSEGRQTRGPYQPETKAGRFSAATRHGRVPTDKDFYTWNPLSVADAYGRSDGGLGGLLKRRKGRTVNAENGYTPMSRFGPGSQSGEVMKRLPEGQSEMMSDAMDFPGREPADPASHRDRQQKIRQMELTRRLLALGFPTKKRAEEAHTKSLRAFVEDEAVPPPARTARRVAPPPLPLTPDSQDPQPPSRPPIARAPRATAAVVPDPQGRVDMKALIDRGERFEGMSWAVPKRIDPLTGLAATGNTDKTIVAGENPTFDLANLPRAILGEQLLTRPDIPAATTGGAPEHGAVDLDEVHAGMRDQATSVDAFVPEEGWIDPEYLAGLQQRDDEAAKEARDKLEKEHAAQAGAGATNLAVLKKSLAGKFAMEGGPAPDLLQLEKNIKIWTDELSLSEGKLPKPQTSEERMALYNKWVNPSREAQYASMNAAIGTQAKASQEHIKSLEAAGEAIKEYSKTGKLPKGRRDALLNKLFLTWGSALLGNHNLAAAMSQGFAASINVIDGEQKNYAKALTDELQAVKAVGELKMKAADSKAAALRNIANARAADAKQDQQMSVKFMEMANKDIATLMTHKRGMLTLSYQALTARVALLNAQKPNASTNQLKAVNQAIRTKFGEYIADYDKALKKAKKDKSSPEKATDKVNADYSTYFGMNPSGVLDANEWKPNAREFAAAARMMQRSATNPWTPAAKISLRNAAIAAHGKLTEKSKNEVMEDNTSMAVLKYLLPGLRSDGKNIIELYNKNKGLVTDNFVKLYEAERTAELNGQPSPLARLGKMKGKTTIRKVKQ